MKRPTLAELATRKPAQEQATPAAPERRADEETRRGAQPDGRKGILIRVNPEGWRQLRDLAAELTLDTGNHVTMQSLITEAINGLLKQHKRPPLA